MKNKKLSGFKMKGYSYPGTSPFKEETINFDVKKKSEIKNTPTGGKDLEVDASIAANSSTSEKKEKEEKKAGINWSGIAEKAITSVVDAGLQAGVDAIVGSGNKNPSRNAPSSSGFTSMQYGSKTNLMS